MLRTSISATSENNNGEELGYKDHPYHGGPRGWRTMNIKALTRNVKSLLGRKLNFHNALTLLLILGVFITYRNLAYLDGLLKDVGSGRGWQLTSSGTAEVHRKKFALHGRRVDSGYLKHVVETFKALDWRRVGVEEEWDVLWSHDYPFSELKDRISTISTSHKVNHFPGSGYITNKMNLATSSLPYVPKAFQIPKQKETLLKYAKDHPHKRFVQKSNNHRGIKIERLENLDLDSTNNTFIQEYIGNPLLIDGHKFDIGIYTILTSIYPLRLYIFSDVLFRFCPEQYHPFDADVLDKYVVGDDYLPIWKVPPLSKYYNDLGFGMKGTFDAWYKIVKKRDPNHIWAQVEAAIRAMYLAKEPNILDSTKKFTGGSLGRNFFEMVRVDFVIDDDGKVYIMEANMSPNLSSAHFPPNQELYRQVLYNLFKLIGIATTPPTTEHAVVADKYLSVFPEECGGQMCAHDCEHVRCSLCQHCLSEEGKQSLKEAYLNQVNSGECLRVFPPSNRYKGLKELEGEDLDGFDTSKLTQENKQEVEWFRGKCELDKSFC